MRKSTTGENVKGASDYIHNTYYLTFVVQEVNLCNFKPI